MPKRKLTEEEKEALRTSIAEELAEDEPEESEEEYLERTEREKEAFAKSVLETQKKMRAEIEEEKRKKNRETIERILTAVEESRTDTNSELRAKKLEVLNVMLSKLNVEENLNNVLSAISDNKELLQLILEYVGIIQLVSKGQIDGFKIECTSKNGSSNFTYRFFKNGKEIFSDQFTEINGKEENEI